MYNDYYIFIHIDLVTVMGSWNATCFLTNTPIFAGEKVRVFLLESQQNEDERYCYPNACWKPMAFSFKGEYDDYGSIRNQEGIMLDYIMESLKKYLVELEQGENSCHDIPITKDTFDFEKMMEANHEGRLFVRSLFGRESHVKIIMTRETTLQRLLEQFKWETYDTTEEELAAGKYYKETSYAEFCAHKQKEMSSIVEKNKNDTSYSLFCMDAIFCRDFTFVGNEFSAVSQLLMKDCPYTFTPNDVVTEATITNVINTFLMAMRRTWTPPSGEGSQQNETEPYKMFAQLLLDECAEIDKQHGEWEEEDEDDE